MFQVALEFRGLLSWHWIFGLCAKGPSLPENILPTELRVIVRGQFSLPSLPPVSPSHFLFAHPIRKCISSENVPDKTKQLLIRSPCLQLGCQHRQEEAAGSLGSSFWLHLVPKLFYVMAGLRKALRPGLCWFLIPLACHHWCYFLVWSSQWDADCFLLHDILVRMQYCKVLSGLYHCCRQFKF